LNNNDDNNNNLKPLLLDSN